MGINSTGVEFLAFARSMNVDFSRSIMIGRQNVYVTHEEMRASLRLFGHAPSDAEIAEVCDGSKGFAEALLRYLGAKKAESIDYSNYQEATHVHDMNLPIPDNLVERYTVVLDGGSLEHVFNFPIAIKNCMRMTSVGGHYLAITPANNFFGHGFYQFSPELYFSVFSEANGFLVEKMIAFEEVDCAVWYSVSSPREASGRVTLCNSNPVYLLIIAKRTARQPIFERPPQQSDYEAIWAPTVKSASQTMCRSPAAPRPLPIRIAKVLIPGSIRQEMRKFLSLLGRPAPRRKGFDPQHFTPMPPRCTRSKERRAPAKDNSLGRWTRD